MKYAMFPADMQNGEIGGGLLEEEGYEPSQQGALIYLNGGDDLGVPLAKVEAAGGQVILPKTSIAPNGFYGAFYRYRRQPDRLSFDEISRDSLKLMK